MGEFKFKIKLKKLVNKYVGVTFINKNGTGNKFYVSKHHIFDNTYEIVDNKDGSVVNKAYKHKDLVNSFKNGTFKIKIDNNGR